MVLLTEITMTIQVDLGIAVQRACENAANSFKFLYSLDISIKDKIEAIAKSYGASGVEYSEQVASSFLDLTTSSSIFDKSGILSFLIYIIDSCTIIHLYNGFAYSAKPLAGTVVF